ncbi:MAG: restriction endonuclease subunit S [Acidimicrobiia bacterium]
MTISSTSWPNVSLGEICEFKYGKSLPSAQRSGGPVTVFGSNGKVGYHCKSLTCGPTIIIGRKGSFGEVNYSDSPCWPIDTTYYVDATSTEADPKWLYYQLAALPLDQLNRAAAIPGLNRDDAHRLRILLPPLDKQRRIATVLDQAEELRAKRREAMTQLYELAQSIFLEMFGGPTSRQERWNISNFRNLVSEFRYGTSNKSQPQGVPALRIPNVANSEIDTSDLKLVPVSTPELGRLRLLEGDLLIVRTNGNPDLVGRCAIYNPEVAVKSGRPGENFIYASYLIRARPKMDVISPVYLREFLLGPAGRRALRSRSKTSAGQFNINTESLGTIEVPVPPLDLQHEYARRVETVAKMKTSHRAHSAELDALFSSLQYRAFRGEL